MNAEQKLRFIESSIILLMEFTEGCEPEPQLPDPPGVTTKAGDLCRLLARINYLLALLCCEANAPDPEVCCDNAYEDYRRAHAACPL